MESKYGPFTAEELVFVGDWIADFLAGQHCDGTPAITRSWVNHCKGANAPACWNFLSTWGGTCDCTILAAIHRREIELEEDWRAKDRARMARKVNEDRAKLAALEAELP